MTWSDAPEDDQHGSSTDAQHAGNASLPPDGSSKSDAAQCAVCTAKARKVAKDAIDMDRVRSHFPVLGGKTVPFNNAAGTVVLKDAIEAASRVMNAMPIDHGDGDARSRAAQAEYSDKLRQCAAFINAEPAEIAFGQSTTALLRLLGQSLRPHLGPDAEMVCSTLCHEASASAWVHLARSLGVTIKWWTPSRDGEDDPCLTVDSLRPLLTPKTRLVTCNHVSNVVGTIHPIRELADLVHTVPGCVFVVDGVAWAPHRPVDVKSLDVDFYCFSWYKVFGPHMAQLYAHRRAQSRHMTSINHFWFDHSTLDGKVHLGTACYELEAMCAPIARYLGDIGWDAIIRQETVLTEVLLDYLVGRPDVYRVFGRRTADPSQRVSIVIFEVLGRQSSDVVMQVHVRDRFRITWGDCWAPRPTFDVLRPHGDGIIRVSFVHYNTVAEVRELCAELDDIVSTSAATGRGLPSDASRSRDGLLGHGENIDASLGTS
ncbi:Pyridoxal phosphate-dependent transferase, major domain protein [Metarhizium album ARSEF 1941]|uniref:Pyridoxal phosphate-dependent transferase, major domain protein n=1 Tax=Metarhizium album (strain ARSEF 1941) TaxID=1081103 RepID=A0A0B2X4L1_METAS|nr:Pyridoxal phosphate-dependent transferase, major domain protein [Metarhizium album ARSEF 1941]KHO01264.1 Pyridoxal phosphate-dependent transferase, major domain protein [Metarhizium album ARSEF 1941]